MPLHAVDHVNIDTSDLAATINFYEQVLGLDPRPKPSGNPGSWLYSGERAIVHVNVVEVPTIVEPGSRATGPFNHVAFNASDLDGLRAAFDDAGHPYRVSERPDLGVTQIFTNDPNGVPIELNIPMT